MTVAPPHPKRPAARSLQQASLLEAPGLLLRGIRGLSSNRTLTWLACIPIALLGLGLFNLSAHAAQLPELTAAFLANNHVRADLRRPGDLHERRFRHG
jgi:Amt family ammonium transporter